MKWRVEAHAVEDLSPADYAECMRLGLKGGALRDELRECRRELTFATVLIVREPTEPRTCIIGWALLSPGYRDRQNLMLYVRKAWRRRGVGTALVHYAQASKPLVTTWDLGSRCFFDRLGFKQRSMKMAAFKTAVDPVRYHALEPA